MRTSRNPSAQDWRFGAGLSLFLIAKVMSRSSIRLSAASGGGEADA
jgi:hypothetical protein